MPGILSSGKGVPLLLIPEYSGINKGQRVPERSKTAHRKPLVKCFLTIPGLGRSTGVGNDNPLQYSCLDNPMDRGAWRAAV